MPDSEERNQTSNARLDRLEPDRPASTMVPQEKWPALVHELVAQVKAYAPDWTGTNSHDPGSMLLELFSFLASDLVAHRSPVNEGHNASDVEPGQTPDVSALLSLCTPLRRVHYFAGKLLTPDDLTAEQDYTLHRLRRHNLLFHGFGVVSGLSVHVESDGQQPAVVVEPGFAIDRVGEEIVLCEPLRLPLPADVERCYVTLAQLEVGVNVTPAAPPASVGSDVSTEPARIEERTSVEISSSPAQNTLTLAALIKDGSEWRPDQSFQVQRSYRRCTAR